MSDSGLEMECEEGHILIWFVSLKDGRSVSDFVETEFAIDEDYSYEELEGKRAKLSLFSNTENVFDVNGKPSYISAIPMGNSLYAIGEGYPVDGYVDDFATIFKNLVETFEP